jgi:hypothetical protein
MYLVLVVADETAMAVFQIIQFRPVQIWAVQI